MYLLQITLFISNFVGEFSIGRVMTQVSMIGLAEFVHPRFRLDNFTNVADLQNAILNQPHGGATVLEPNITA